MPGAPADCFLSVSSAALVAPLAILVIMGGVIMTILLSVYLPIFRIMSQIKG